MNVRDIMSSPVFSIRADETVGKAADLMLLYETSCLPVLEDDGQLVGILTHTDFGFHRRFMPIAGYLYTIMGSSVTPAVIEQVSKEVSSRMVRQVMSHPAITVQEDSPLAEVADLMVRKNIHRLPVIRGKELVGIVTRHDFLKLMATNEMPH